MTFGGGQGSQRSTGTLHAGGDYLTEETAIHPFPLYQSRKRHCCHRSDGFTVISLCFFVLTVAVTFALIIQIYYGSPEVMPHGAIATDADECSHIGMTILQEGGTAVDVAIASLLCMTVVHPHAVGPGGSGVMLVHDHKRNETSVIDFMSDVPASYISDSVETETTGGPSIGVPGFLRGLEYAHKKFGKVTWHTLFKPSITLARDGFNVSTHLGNALENLDILESDGRTPFLETFFPNSRKLKKGDYMRREEYADFLEVIAKEGAEGLYALDFAAEEMLTLKQAKSNIHVRDLHNYKVKEHPCIHTTFQNKTIFTAPAPFGGPQLLLALQMLSNSSLTQASPTTFYLKFIEAFRRSYAEFIQLATVEEQDLQRRTESLLGSTSEIAINSTINPSNLELPQIIDQASTAVSVIDTFDQYVTTVAGLGNYFGSRVMTRHGILFNNHLANVPVGAYAEEKGYSRARPLSVYTPIIITDTQQVCGQRVALSSPEVGAAIQVVSHLIFKHMNLTAAIDNQARITIKPGLDNVYYVEDLEDLPRISGTVHNSLHAMNQTSVVLKQPYASVNGISKLKDKLISCSDRRGGGIAHRLEPSSKN